MAEYKRFMARRGRCAHTYSDNGTNFVGASEILENEVNDLTQKPPLQNECLTIEGSGCPEFWRPVRI